MTEEELRKADRKRLVRKIVEHLDEFPRQYAALETAMAAFGTDFDLGPFKAAFDTTDDLEAYNRAQAVERALGRVQNFVAQLAISGARLAGLRQETGGDGSRAKQAFATLRDAKVIDGELHRRLVRAQEARSTIEHEYVRLPAGRVHAATLLVHHAAPDFIDAFRTWVEPYLEAL